MSVVIETTVGDITVDLFTTERPRACLNFVKLCKMKYYNLNLFHNIERGFIAQTGDPTGDRTGGESIHGLIHGPEKRFFSRERTPKIRHSRMGLISFVGTGRGMLASQFFFTLGHDLRYLDKWHCVFGQVMEGLDVLDLLNDAICDYTNRPYKDIRITHTVVLDDPFDDPPGMVAPSCSPEATEERLRGGRIAADEELDDSQGRTEDEVTEMVADREAKARATILEMVGDLPDAEIAPPENVLFVCKLNPVTTEDDLEIIFSRFGSIDSCEVIRDKKSGNSLQYAFIQFGSAKSCEDAFFKMDNVLIDDRRIHVDFSQSVGKIRWLGKGRLQREDVDDGDLGRGTYLRKQVPENRSRDRRSPQRPSRPRRPSPSRNTPPRYEARERGHYSDESGSRRAEMRRSERDRYAYGRPRSASDRSRSRQRGSGPYRHVDKRRSPPPRREREERPGTSRDWRRERRY